MMVTSQHVRADEGEQGGTDRGPGRRGRALTVVVDDRGIEAALRVFKRLVLKEGLLKDIKRHEHYEKPGDRKRRKTRDAIRRRRRQAARLRSRFGGDSE
jgi:small subunit ribosomal protein S21